MGTDENSLTGYKAYRVSGTNMPTAIEKNSSMPWGLITEAQLFRSKFWLQNLIAHRGFTFDETTKTFLMVVSWNDEPGESVNEYHIYSKALTADGDLPDGFNSTVSGKYSSLLDWKSKIYGLKDNKFIFLGYGTNLSGTEEVFVLYLNICLIL